MIICAGESLIDFVPLQSSSDGLPDYSPVPGGSPFNCSIAASRLGADVAFAGAVSTDFFGAEIAHRLETNGVSLAMVTRVDQPTTLAFVKKAPDGSAAYAFYADGSADRSLSAAMLPESLPEDAILQLGSISLIATPQSDTLVELAEREAGKRIIMLDPNVRPTLIADEPAYRATLMRVLATTDILKASDEDLFWLSGTSTLEDAAQWALGTGPAAVVVTRGEEGSSLHTGSVRVDADAMPTVVVDTIGAGDSFMAALLVWMDERGIRSRASIEGAASHQWAEALGFAARVSALVCARKGCDPPRRADLPSAS